MRRYGFFKNKRIVLYDTLIEQCREPEVVAVLAHELGRPPGFPSTSHTLLHTLDRIAICTDNWLARAFIHCDRLTKPEVCWA